MQRCQRCTKAGRERKLLIAAPRAWPGAPSQSSTGVTVTDHGVWASIWTWSGALCMAGAALGLVSLLLIPASWLSIMIFDSPVTGNLDLAGRWGFVAAIVIAPLLSIVSGVCYIVHGSKTTGGGAAAAAAAFGVLWVLLACAAVCAVPDAWSKLMGGRAGKSSPPGSADSRCGVAFSNLLFTTLWLGIFAVDLVFLVGLGWPPLYWASCRT